MLHVELYIDYINGLCNSLGPHYIPLDMIENIYLLNLMKLHLPVDHVCYCSFVQIDGSLQ